MNPNLALAFTTASDALRPHLLAVALIAARIAPATFLCPVFGGKVAPQTVRVALCLALALHAHFAGDVNPAFSANADLFTVVAAFVRELFCGAAIGLVAALPFDAARMGGRFLDTFRGANAEATLPVTGSQEAATGDLLHQLVCALAFAGVGYRALAVSVLGSFRFAPLGGAIHDTGAVADLVVTHATGALAAGLAIGAPCAAASLLVDAALGFAARAAPGLSLRDVGAPAKLLVGSAAILLSLGGISERLLVEIGNSAAAIDATSKLLGGAP